MPAVTPRPKETLMQVLLVLLAAGFERKPASPPTSRPLTVAASETDLEPLVES
jgi:hypothetical protein